MCGITGIFDFSPSKAESIKEQIKRMNTAINHRGPDSSDFWLESSIPLALGHTRLAIHDLSPTGTQPMTSKSERYIIVYNGEIYNFKDLKKTLENQGECFKGSSDTEVLLALIERVGLQKAIHQCKGMFALALFDQKTQRLYLARDRLGEKPLYYGICNQTLVFASELKSIYAIQPAKDLNIDFSALASYLRYGYISAPFSIFQELKKLEPGHILTIPLNKPSLIDNTKKLLSFSEPYWHIEQVKHTSKLIKNEKVAKHQLDQLLNKVINEQALADVPLGAFLSGGIDSSVVASILQSNSSNSIETFTIGFDDDSFNEAKHAKAIAKHIGSRHNELYIKANDALLKVEHLAHTYDEPFADSSQIPMMIVSELARKNVTACLSGDGGDELFAGYNRYTFTENLHKKTQLIPPYLRNIISKSLNIPSPSSWDKLALIYQRLRHKKGSASVGLKVQKLAEILKHESLNESYLYLMGYWQNPNQLLKNSTDEPILDISSNFEANFLDAAMHWDQKWYLPGDNLVKTDRASMQASLEMRLPLLDKEVIEFAWSIPNSMKLRGGQSKWLLRQVLYDYVPKQLIERPKMGFSIPIADWIRNELKDWAYDLLSPKFLNRQEIFNPIEVRKVYEQHMSGKHDHSHKLWTILMFQAWYKEHME